MLSFLNLISRYIILLLLILTFIYDSKGTDKLVLKTEVGTNDYIIKNNKYYLKFGLIEKFNSYLNICKQGKLIDATKYPLLKKPKISIIIPVYNGGKYLNYSLRTIQNQNLKEIEIIIIDDYSTDDSLIYIDRLMKEDYRIRLIKNHKNRKILYSKSIAVLNSNAEFILNLDQDDIFIREDLFKIIYIESKKFNLDLVQFRDFVKENFFFKRKTRINHGNLHWIQHNKNIYIEEPELKKTLFTRHYNYLLWGLLINSNIYKKALYHIWEFIMNYKIVYNEDYVSTTIILLLSQNYKFLNMFGILHLKHLNSTSFNCFNETEFYLSNIIFPKYLNDYIVKYNQEDVKLIYKYIKLNKIFQQKASNFYQEFFDFNIRTLFYNNYFLQKEKNSIINIFNITKNKSNRLSTYVSLMNSSEFKSILKFQKSVSYISSKNKDYMYQVINETTLNKSFLQYIYINNQKTYFNTNKIINLGINNNKITNHKNLYPKISIIIYCKEIKYLDETLISIIRQKDFFSFEIIIVYDGKDKLSLSNNFSYDNIFIINNINPKGMMVSLIDGVLASKGQYIIIFQSGYTFSKKDVLLNLYEMGNYKKIDVLEFNLLINKDDRINKKSLNLFRCHHYNSSLNTSTIKYNEKYKEIDQDKDLLINKLIRTEILKVLIINNKLYKYEKIIYNNCDDIIIFLINKSKYNNFYHADIFGVIKNIKKVNSLKLNKISNNIKRKINDYFFYIYFLFDHSENNHEDIKFVYTEYINLLGTISNKLSPKTDKSIKILKKFINSIDINEYEKQNLIFFYNSLNN